MKMIFVVLILVVYATVVTILFAEAKSDLEEERDSRACDNSHHNSIINQAQKSIDSEREAYRLAVEEYKDEIRKLEEAYNRFAGAIKVVVDREIDISNGDEDE